MVPLLSSSEEIKKVVANPGAEIIPQDEVRD